MNLTLHELMDAVTLEGSIRVRIWNDETNDYSFDKWLEEFTDADLWVYGYPVKYIYPYRAITGTARHSAVAIELNMEV